MSRGHGIYFNKMCISGGHATNNLKLLVHCRLGGASEAGKSDAKPNLSPKQNKTMREIVGMQEQSLQESHVLIRAPESRHFSRFANTRKVWGISPMSNSIRNPLLPTSLPTIKTEKVSNLCQKSREEAAAEAGRETAAQPGYEAMKGAQLWESQKVEHGWGWKMQKKEHKSKKRNT